MFDAEDPYREIGELRRSGGIVPYVSRGGVDAFFVTRHAEAAAVLGDATRYSTSFLSAALAPMVGDSALVGLEGDRHRSHRLLLTGALTSGSLRTKHEPELRRMIDELVVPIAQAGSADLIADLALPLPGRVLAVILGLPEAESIKLQSWSVQLLTNARAGTQDDTLQTTLVESLAPAIEAARAHPGDNVLGHLVGADIAGTPLSDEDICTLVGFLLVAGLETFHRAIGNLLFALLTHPEQLAAVRAEPKLRRFAVEEALRWESPITLTVRDVVADSSVGGTAVPEGSLLYVLLSSANHDERQYERPEQFDITREPKPHLTFGRGPHVCPGASLSRMALGLLLDRWLDATAHVEIDGSVEAPVIRGEIFRSPDALPVTCRFAP
jgi:cytochrome P450